MAYLLQHLLTEAAARRPQRPAVASGGSELSYQELDRLSTKVARALLRRGVEPGDRVAILVSKSATAVIGLYGALKAGACYVPLDTKAPAERLGYVVRDCAAAVIIADDTTAAQAAVLAEGVPGSRGVLLPGAPEVAGEPDEPLAGRPGDRDRPRVHPVHVGFDRRPEGCHDLPPQLAHVRRVGCGRRPAHRAGSRLQPSAAAFRPVGL